VVEHPLQRRDLRRGRLGIEPPRGVAALGLLYFLCNALATLTAPADAAAKERTMLALLRGESPASARLFDRVRAAAETFVVPLDAVGPVVTLGWMHHRLSAAAAAARSREGARFGAATGSQEDVGPLERLARPWLVDEQLGPGWPAFVRGRRTSS
jgi:hypothetical protein